MCVCVCVRARVCACVCLSRRRKLTKFTGTHVFQDGVCLHFVVTWRTDLRETCRQQKKGTQKRGWFPVIHTSDRSSRTPNLSSLRATEKPRQMFQTRPVGKICFSFKKYFLCQRGKKWNQEQSRQQNGGQTIMT